MSPQPPPIPSPADLARTARPRPQPRLKPSPPRPPSGHRLAEIEKERALRALVADPATNFAALGDDEFSATLRCARADGTVARALIADAERRISDGTTAPRDLHEVLFPGSADQASADQAWESARAAAMAAIAAQPHLAVEVLGLHAQRLGVAGMRVDESTDAGRFTAVASMEAGGGLVQGARRVAASKKRARQEAAVSLLARLTGLPAPSVAPDAAPQPTTENAAGKSVPTITAAKPRLSAADLEAWLDYEIGRPAPDPEFVHEITAGNLSVRSIYLLLFEASPQGWAVQRALAAAALSAAPAAAAGVLSMHTQARGLPPVRYAETSPNTAAAFLATPDGPVVGEPAIAATLKAARAAAAFALVRDLAPATPQAPAPAPGPAAVPSPGKGPVSALNERAQTGVITGLAYSTSSEGAAHQPVFTCTASCRYATRDYTCTAQGRSKSEAKISAATGLLDQIAAADREAGAHLDRLHRDQARSAPGIFERLLRAGCAVDLTPGPRFAIDTDLPDPLDGWTLPLSSALPVLARLSGSSRSGSSPELHPSARDWAQATRSALEAVAARRVHPAMDDDGRDRWRIAPDTAVPDSIDAEPFLDAVAEALLRPPGARFVVGDLPYAGRSRTLDPDAALWADQSADAAEGTTPAPLAIRVRPPEAEGQPLHVEFKCEGRVPGRAEMRLVRRAARDWPPLARIAAEGTLSGDEAAQLLGTARGLLATHQITVEWPADLAPADGSGLGVSAVVRSRGGESATFSLAGAADLAWQLTLGGTPLSQQETAAVAAAVDGVLRLRGRWVVLDAGTRQRALQSTGQQPAGQLTGAQALQAALTGQVTVDGIEVDCSAAGHLADVIAELRAGGDDGTASGSGYLGIDGLTAELRGYQRRGVAWLARTTALGFGALLADDMGLGKTLTVIAYYLTRQNAGPMLVVCPASLLANWEREIGRFAPGVAVRRYHGAGRSVAEVAGGLGPVACITTYGTLLRDADALATVPWDLVVADEAQQVKNHRSQAAQALRLLRPQARVAVTGTPVENSLAELWAILDWANPELFGSLAAFRDRYGRAIEQGGDDGQATARRLARLISPFMLRRRKADPGVAPDLPEKIARDRYGQLSDEQAALYQAESARLLGRITASAGLERRGQVLRLLQSLRQICNSPAHFLREPADGWDADAQAARSGKLAALDELLESVSAAGEAALIFTGYVSMGNLISAHLAARGMTARFVHGGLPVARRQEIVDEFQAGEGDALILSVRAAGTGLNLTRATHVIHYDRPWNPAVEDQATDRAHRIGARATVMVHRLIAEGTVEDRIAELLARKRGLTEAVLAGGETALTELSDGELRALVSLGAGSSARDGTSAGGGA